METDLQYFQFFDLVFKKKLCIVLQEFIYNKKNQVQD